jgi:hypothetical protein
MMRFLSKFGLSTLLIIIITILSIINFSSMDIKPPVKEFDKLVHALMYTALSFVLLFDITKNVLLLNKAAVVKITAFSMAISFLISATTGGILELIQEYFVEGRSGDWIDMICNVIGSFVGIALGLLVIPKLLGLIRKSAFFQKI